jgi:hypothetical protein
VSKVIRISSLLTCLAPRAAPEKADTQDREAAKPLRHNALIMQHPILPSSVVGVCGIA